jgi:hypothetical protein
VEAGPRLLADAARVAFETAAKPETLEACPVAEELTEAKLDQSYRETSCFQVRLGLLPRALPGAIFEGIKVLVSY